jgi:chemotaxis protein histidine kinase CheA
MILAWLLLLTGLTISAVAIYYSVVGLAAIFAAATIPIYIMGTTLEVAKLVCASWLKANWERVPVLMKTYMTIAVIVLMIITSMGIFGFLSKAHMDQTLVSGDVASKIAIIDEKIKTEKDNIESAKKALAQMDATVDQTIARSTNEAGAGRAAQLRRTQAKERAALQADITKAQKNIVALNDEAAPIRAEVRKVEAEVGPIKYIAAFVYGDNPDANLLEKAVTWVIIIIVSVFDPLAVIMLLAAQMTFAWARSQKEQESVKPDSWIADVGEKPTKEELEETEKVEPVLPKQFIDHGEHPKDNYGYEEPVVEYKVVEDADEEPIETVLDKLAENPEASIEGVSVDQWNKMIEEAEAAVAAERKLIEQEAKKYRPNEGTEFPENPFEGQRFTRVDFEPHRDFVYNGNAWVNATSLNTDTDSKKKSYMTKDELGKIQVKNRT